MVKKPLVSVITTCYNQAQFLPEAVRSVQEQTYEHWELIIIDDGSTDNTSEVGRMLEKKDVRVRFVHQKNQGLAASRNNGYLIAEGEYIQFLDADDFIISGKLEEQVKIMEEDLSIGVCYSNYLTFTGNPDNTAGRYSEHFLGEDPLTDFLFKWERGLSIPIHSALFRKSVFHQGRPFINDLKAKEDWVMWVELALNKTQFYFIDKNYALYRMHFNQMSKDDYAMAKQFLKAFSIILRKLPEDRDMVAKFVTESIEHLKYYTLLPGYHATLFCNSGCGYNIEESFSTNLNVDGLDFTGLFKIVCNKKPLALKLELINNQLCRCKILEVETDNAYQSISCCNAGNVESGWDFDYSHNPTYYFNGDFSHATWLKIKGQIKLLSNYEVSNCIKRTERHLESILNTNSWKITAPIRGVSNWLKHKLNQ